MLRRLARAWLPSAARPLWHSTARLLRRGFYAGDRVGCPCCGGRFRSFRSEGVVAARPAARCPGCGAFERHRTLALFLSERTALLRDPHHLLHVAPEPALARLLKTAPTLRTTSVDLASPHAHCRADLGALPFAPGSFDAILCVHVLEHVRDDHAALRELFRVLRPGGWAVLQVPVDPGLSHTDEDASVTDPRERERRFGQADHLRLYGEDYEGRLRAAGFDVFRDRFVQDLPAARARELGLSPEDIYVASRP